MPKRWGAFLLVIGGLVLLTAVFMLARGLSSNSMPFTPDTKFSDSVTSHWPNALFLQRSIREDGTLPLWRNQIMSGQPFAANPLNKTWYPPQWLVVVLPVTLSLNLLIWLTLIIAGTGAWLWARQTGLEKIPAALVAFGYILAPRLIAAVGAGHLDVLYAVSWQAWLYWAVWRFVHHPEQRRQNSLLLAIFTTLIFLSDVRLAVYIYLFALAYAVYLITRLPDKKWWPALRWGFVAGGFAVLLTAVQWLPLFDLTPDLSRNRISETEAGIASIEAGEFLSLMIANHETNPEKMLYVGVGVFALALVAVMMRPRQMVFWVGVIIIAAWWGMGQNSLLWTSAVRLFPSLLWFRVPARAWLVVALILPYMAGWGLQWIGAISPEALKKRAIRLSAVGTFGFSAVCWLSSLFTLAEALPAEALIGLIALPLSVGLILLGAWRLISLRTFQIAFVLLMLVDVMWVGRSMVEWRNRDEWLDEYRPLAEMLKADGVERVYSPSYSLPQQAAAYWRIPQFDGIDPFQLESYVAEAERITGVKAKGYSVTIPAFDLPDDADEDDLATINQNAVIDVQGLADWRVTHVVSAFEIDADGLELLDKVGDVYVYRNTLIAPAVRITWHGPNRVAISPTDSNIHAFADTPDWENPPDGEYQYTPDSQSIGMALSGIGLLGLVVLAFVGRRKSHA